MVPHMLHIPLILGVDSRRHPIRGTGERRNSAVQETHCRLLGEMPPRQEGASGKKPTVGEAKFQGS